MWRLGQVATRRLGAHLNLRLSSTVGETKHTTPLSALPGCLIRCRTTTTTSEAKRSGDDIPDEKLSVSQLKYFLDSAGINYRDCYEKRELVSRLNSAQQNLSPHLRNELAQYLEVCRR